MTAHWTINIVTMQLAMRTVLHPTLSRQFRTNNSQLRYHRLAVDCFTDKQISTTLSHRNDKYAQIFSTSNGLCSAGYWGWLKRDSCSSNNGKVFPAQLEWTWDVSRPWACSVGNDVTKKALTWSRLNHTLLGPTRWTEATIMELKEGIDWEMGGWELQSRGCEIFSQSARYTSGPSLLTSSSH